MLNKFYIINRQLGVILLLLFFYAKFVNTTHSHYKASHNKSQQELTEKCNVCEAFHQSVNFTPQNIIVNTSFTVVDFTIIHFFKYQYKPSKLFQGRSPPKV